MKFNPFRILLALLVYTSLLYVTYRLTLGFYAPDPVLFAKDAMTRMLVQTLRVLVPLILLGVTSLFFLLSLNIISGKACILVIVGTALGLTLFAGGGAITYVLVERAPNLSEYHSFLQISPHDCFSSESHDQSKYHVAFLGGSSTEWADSQGLDWPARVGAQLEKISSERKVVTHNCGRQWYTSLHSLLNYHSNIRLFKPNLLVIMHSINDLLHNADFNYYSIRPFRNDYGHFLGPTVEIVNRKPLLSSLLFRLQRTWNFAPREVLDLNSFKGIPSYKENLRSLIRLAKSDGTKIVIMSEPTLLKEQLNDKEKERMIMINAEAVGHKAQWSHGTAYRGMKQYNAAAREVSEEEGAYFHDLEREIPPTLEYFLDEVHYTDNAFPLVAKSVYEYLASHDELLRP
jgi:GDSL-like Lipase/Acylhydrolase family